MEKKDNKFLNFVKLRKDYLIVFMVLFVIYNFLLIINSCFPYGQGTVLISDSYHQIGLVINHIFDVFEGKASFFYTNHIGGGMEIFTTIQYMLMSPFYIFPLLGGRNYAMPLFNISAFFMLVFVAFTFLWFSKKYFKNISLPVRLLFTLLYTFSAYMLSNAAFLTWLIYPALILFLIDAFLKLVNEGKIVRFCVFLVWYVINCFSVGICTNILLFVLFSAYIFFTKEKGSRAPYFARLFVAYVIGICASVIVLFPSIIATLSAGRTGSSFSMLIRHFGTSYFIKLSPILFDGIVSVLAIFYLIKANKKDNNYKFYLFALILTLIPVLFDGSLRLICGSGYSGFIHRFYFINEVVVFVMALNVFDKNLITINEEAKSTKMFKVLYIFIISLAIICFSLFFIFNGESFSATSKNPLNADLAILLVSALLFVCAALMFVYVYFFNRRGTLSSKFAKIGVIISLVFTLVLNSLNFVCFMNTDYSYLNDEKKLISSVNISGRMQYFKYENTVSNYYDSNLMVITAFSSLIDQKIMEADANIGVNTRIVDIVSEGETIITDSLMGLKYVITSNKENRPYLKEIASDGEIYIYENTLATTGAILFDNNTNLNLNLSTLEGLNKFAENLGIEGELIKEIQPEINKLDKEVEGNKQVYEVSFKSDSDVIIYSNMSNSFMTDENLTKYFTAEQISNGVLCLKDPTEIFFDVDYLSKDSSLSKVFIIENKTTIEELKLYALSYDVAKQVCEKLQERQVQIEYKKDGFAISSNFDENGKLFVSIVNIKGMYFAVNGEQTNIGEVFGGFAYIDVKAGENTITASYKYPHFKSWIIITVVCIAVIVMFALLYKFNLFNRLNRAIGVLVYAINIIILSIFIFFGIILTFIVLCLSI